MQADWLWALAGGGMIGMAAALYLLINGRIMGASGIIGDLVDGSAGRNWAEPAAFLAGLIIVPAVLVQVTGGADTHLTPVLWLVVIGGILVGLGGRLANGCTSGHGVCGISRLSPRGIMATFCYVGAGVVTISLLRHVWGVL